MNSQAYIIQNLLFSYPGTGSKSSGEKVLDIPHLEIEKGKITVLRGHNGSGKTTLMKLMCTILSPVRGSILNPGNLHGVLVQQEPYLFHSTVQHNLAAPLRFLKRGNNEGLIKRNLSLVGLEGFEKRKAWELSGGERKRVAIARALTAEPDVLFLDEPDANVDAAISSELETLILSLKKSGMTIILCSHHKGFAYRTADRLIDLYRGKLVAHDENIFKGHYHYQDALYSCFHTTQGLQLNCPTRQGVYSSVVIPPENIALSRDSVDSDKDNQLDGVLQSIEASKEGRFTLVLDCGDFLMKARLSATEISLQQYRRGEKLKLIFNPSALHLY